MYNPNINSKFANKHTARVYPLHDLAKNMAFEMTAEEYNASGSSAAELEANLADAVARVAEHNGLSVNDVMHVFPYILRMLKSNSEWAR